MGLKIDPVIDERSRERLKEGKIMLLFCSAFFGQLCSRLPLVNADAWCPTAASDGKHFFYNSRFIDMLKDDELTFLFGHEVLHCVYDHLGRTKDSCANPRLANIAQDYVINGDLVKSNIGELITTISILYEKSKFDGMTSEEVYEYLYGNLDELDLSGLIDKLLDDHLDGDDENGDGVGGGEGKGIDEYDENGNPVSTKKPKYSKSEQGKIRDEIKRAVLNAYKQDKNAGNLPGGIKRMVDSLTKNNLNWRELIQQEIQSTIKSSHSYMRPSRKGWHMNAVLPGMVNDTTIDVCVAIDLSGSVGEHQMRDFIGEIKSIMETYTMFNLKLFTFDTQVYNECDFDENNADELDTYPFDGGGGTDFMACWEYMDDNGITPKMFIMFTDGYPCGEWGIADAFPTVFVIYSENNSKEDRPVAPFGITCDYDEAKEKNNDNI